MSTTPNLLISHIAANQNQKEVTANTAFDEFDEALCNTKSQAITGNFSVAQADFLYNFVLIYTGTLSGAANITVTANKKPFVVSNQTSGGFALTVKVGSGSNVAVIPADSKYYLLYCDGANSVYTLRPVTVSASSVPISVFNKKGSGSGNYTGQNTAYVNIDSSNLLFTVTIPVGSDLVVRATGAFKADSSPATEVGVSYALADNGAVIIEKDNVQAVPSAMSDFALETVIVGDGNAHTISLQFLTLDPSAAWEVQNNSSTAKPTLTATLLPAN